MIENTNLNWPTAITLWLIVIGWLHGIAVAKGFLSAFFAIIIPVYAWFLSVSWFVSLVE